MKPRFLFLAAGLLAVPHIGAQVVSVEQISVTRTEGENGLAWQTLVTLAVPAEVAGDLISIDAKKSSVHEVTDADSGQPVKVDPQFMEKRFSGNSRETEKFNMNLTITAPPETPRAWLKLKGTLVLNTLVETKKHKAVIKLIDGTSFKAGDILLTVKDIRSWGDSMGFTLSREDGSLAPVHDIRFSDGEGNPVEVNHRGGGSSSRNNKIISESRSFACPDGFEELHAEFELVEREGAKEVPFDVTLPVNP